MKQFLEKKEKGFWCSVAAIVLFAAGIVFYRMLTAVSFETTERPVLVLVFAFTAVFFSMIASYKDFFKVPSILAYAAATLAFFTLLEGRTSYLAFYFSGDVMHTGLSPYMIGSFICFLLAMLAALFAVIFEEDKGGRPKLMTADWKVILPMFCVIAILSLVVCLNVEGTKGETAAAPSGAEQPAQNYAASESEAQPQTEAKFKTPKTSEAVWQEYSAADFANESLENKPIAYQLVGGGDVDAGGPVRFDGLVNLYEDGMVVASVFGRNSGYRYYGYWTNEADDHLWFCVMYYTALGQNQICTIDYGYELTGHFDEITLNIALGLADGGQFVRTIPVGGDGSVQYPSVRDWFAGFDYEMPEAVYTPTAPAATEQPAQETTADKAGVLFPFTADVDSFQLDINKDGTYEFRFTSMNIVENGTWTWENWVLTLTTPNGRTAIAEIDGETHALNITFIPDISDQLVRDYTAEASVWGQAFSGQGNYPAE